MKRVASRHLPSAKRALQPVLAAKRAVFLHEHLVKKGVPPKPSAKREVEFRRRRSARKVAFAQFQNRCRRQRRCPSRSCRRKPSAKKGAAGCSEAAIRTSVG